LTAADVMQLPIAENVPLQQANLMAGFQHNVTQRNVTQPRWLRYVALRHVMLETTVTKFACFNNVPQRRASAQS